MKSRIVSFAVLAVIFILVLIPSLHIPKLSDDYYYILLANLHDQLGHYKGWSGRILTNIFSSYMLRYVPHAVYETLTAAAVALTVYLIACLPSVVFHGKVKASWISLAIVFMLLWIANPALGETVFWFIGAANYLWPVFYISLFLVLIARQKDKLTPLNIIFSFVVGILAGCSNENTCIVLILLVIPYAIYTKKFSVIYPHIVGLVIGAAILLLSPGAALRSTVFTDWHKLTLIEKIDLQLFTRMPDSLEGLWPVYLVLITLTLISGAICHKEKSKSIYALAFFIASILCNAAFIASPFMPERAYSGALFMLLFSVSFAIQAVLDSECKKTANTTFVFIILFGLVYFIPSYSLFTNAVMRAWKQETIRMNMLQTDIENGEKVITLPDFYFTRLLKKTDGYPVYKHPAKNEYFGVKEINEVPVDFDYSDLNKMKHTDVYAKIYEGIYLKGVYLYHDKLKDNYKIIYRVSGDINKAFLSGIPIYSHVLMNGKEEFINKDTANQAIKIGDDWYTYSDAKDIDLSNIKKIVIGMYKVSNVEIYSSVEVNF